MTIVLDSNEFIPTQRVEVKKQIDEVLDDFMEPLFNSIVIPEIKSLSDAANLPKSFANGVKFRRIQPNRGEVINTWGTEKEPLARYFNYGTSMHWIEPSKSGGVLAFPAKQGRHASAIFFKGPIKEGDTLFSKGHYVSGVPRTEVMERGFQIGKKRLVIEAGKIVRSELA